ncbi:hypothetical protein MUO14_13495 [Halobacillus shinanisalinarum]|uniref:Uncharacterized protein n=1 Tax=Halobacillus shinanisalinarum TaxID=2932258 RepID=A0ABY4H661_9BACI|nr:hypothetical protein [Halobacillus shinanisalinarum]UOQ95691.1 hypothetical protein MUO14_13495 [Halobacillus shinanisalinarum]
MAGSDRSYITSNQGSVEFNVSLGQSSVSLPIVGGKKELGF